MFNPAFTDPNNSLLADRLQQDAQILRQASYATMEEYQAAVFSAVNQILARGNQMRPLAGILPGGPASVGDLGTNLTQLSQDLNDIVSEISRIEGLTAGFYNRAAAAQNELRQAIRELVYASNSRTFVEAFLTRNQISSSTATLDFAGSVASLPVSSDTIVAFTPALGPNSVGTLSGSLDALSDSSDTTSILFNGSVLELLFTTSPAKIINRMVLNLDDYQNLEITAMVTSPDGTAVQDVLADLGQAAILIDGLSGKYSGNVILDFPPRFAQSVRLIISDLVGDNRISLRNVEFHARAFAGSAQLTTNPIYSPAGTLTFATTQIVPDPYTSITHQISANGTEFTAIVPGTVTATTPFYYRAVLARDTSQFVTSPIARTLDPNYSSNYSLSSSSAVPLGSSLLQRTLIFTSISGPITFRDTPLPGTLRVQEGALILTSGTDYTWDPTTSTLSFSQAVSGITVSYQMSSQTNASLTDLEDYYSPFLYEVSFSA